MKKQSLRLILIGSFLLFSIWLAWPDTTSLEVTNGTETTQQRSKRNSLDLLGIDENPNSKRSLNRAQSSEESGLERISRLITNETLSNHEVAVQLLSIAKDKRLPEVVRAEALGHGAILELPVFVKLASDTQFPEEMAEDLLDHVINENGNRELQIRAYVDFLNHSSSEIREEAKQMLAFILEDDLGEADEATLIQMADAKLKQLEAEKSQGDK